MTSEAFPPASLAYGKKVTHGDMTFVAKWEPIDDRLVPERPFHPGDPFVKQEEIPRPLQGHRKKQEKKRILEFSSFGSPNMNPDEMFGDFDCDDKPKNIRKVRKCNGYLEFVVEWQARDNGFQPKDSVVTNRELRKFAPEFLLDFYEARIVLADHP